MEKKNLDNLKNQVIRAFVAHELGEELLFSDKVYDEKLSLIMKEDPDFNIYDFQPNYSDSDYVPHRSGMEDLEKEHIHNLEDYWNQEEGYHKTPKYDGSSIVLYYTNGKFTRAVSMRNKESGCDQTEKFSSFAPKEVDPSISYIRCECLIDVRVDDNARGKANGLVNSRYLQEEVDEKASLIAFCAHDLNGKKLSWDEFISLLSGVSIIRDNGLPKFLVTPQVHEMTLSDKVVMYKSSLIDFQFAIDGVVYYEDDFAYKYDYVDSALSTVLSVNWAETDRECWFPTVSIEPVELDGAEIRNPSSNGVPNLIKLGIGVGAVVEVVRSGLTIPKIVNTVKKVEVEFPKCPYCDYQMTEDDLYGSALKCSNPDCIGKYNTRFNYVQNWESTLPGGHEECKQWYENNIEEGFFDLLNVSRFNYATKRYLPESEVLNKLLEILRDSTLDELKEFLWNAYHWSDLQWSEMEINLKSTYRVFNEFILK